MSTFDPFAILETCEMSMKTCNVQADVPALIKKIGKEIDKGYDINTLDSYGGSLLIDAADRGIIEACEMLIEKGIDVTIRGDDKRTALHYAAKTGMYPVVEKLIKQGLEVNDVCPKGFSPLTMACSNARNCHLLDFTVKDSKTGKEIKGHPKKKEVESGYKAFSKTLKLLIKNGAKLEPVMTETQGTPIFFLAETSDNNMLKMMIKEGVNVNHKDKWGLTPLHFAARNGGNVQIKQTIKLLLDAGSNVNEQDNYGFTPLFEAVLGNHISAAKQLLKAGTDTSIKLTEGFAPYTNHETVLDIAKDNKFTKLEKLLT